MLILPTLANIRQAVIDLEKNLQSGDFVYLHFSGHGSQAPALKPDQELDGLDELFLPADTGAWNKSVGTVENALVDDEIGSLIDRLRKKGATVWAVFDSCHSGTVTRAVSTGDSRDRGTPRKLSPPALLKFQTIEWLDARRTTTRSVGGQQCKGRTPQPWISRKLPTRPTVVSLPFMRLKPTKPTPENALARRGAGSCHPWTIHLYAV